MQDIAVTAWRADKVRAAFESMASTFSFELVVLSVDNIVGQQGDCQLPAIVVQFLDFTHLTIRPAKQARHEHEIDKDTASVNHHGQGGPGGSKRVGGMRRKDSNSIRFDSGKSCLFELEASALRSNIERYPLQCILVDEWRKPAVMLGCSTLHISQEVEGLVRGHHTNSIARDVAQQPLVNLMGSRVGSLHVRYRLVHIGRDIQCHLHGVVQPSTTGNSDRNDSRRQQPEQSAAETMSGKKTKHTAPAIKLQSPTLDNMPMIGASWGSASRGRVSNGQQTESAPVPAACTVTPVDAVERRNGVPQNYPKQHTEEGPMPVHCDRSDVDAADTQTGLPQASHPSEPTHPSLKHQQQNTKPGPALIDVPGNGEFVTNTICPPPMLYTSRLASSKGRATSKVDSMSENERYLRLAKRLASAGHTPPAVVGQQATETWNTLAGGMDNNHPINTRLVGDIPHLEEDRACAAHHQRVQHDLTHDQIDSYIRQGYDHAAHTRPPNTTRSSEHYSVLSSLLHELVELVDGARRAPPVAHTSEWDRSVPHRTGISVHQSASLKKPHSRKKGYSHQAQASDEVEALNTRELAQSVYAHLLQKQVHDTSFQTAEEPPVTTALQLDRVSSSPSSVSSTAFIPASASVSPRQPKGKWNNPSSSGACANPGSDTGSPVISTRRKKVLRRRSSTKLSVAPVHPPAPLPTKVEATAPEQSQRKGKKKPVHLNLEANDGGLQPNGPMKLLKSPALARFAEENLTNVSDSSNCLPKVLVFLPSHTESGGSGGRSKQPPAGPHGPQDATSQQRRAAAKGRMKRRKSLLDAWPMIAGTSSAMSADSDSPLASKVKLPQHPPNPSSSGKADVEKNAHNSTSSSISSHSLSSVHTPAADHVGSSTTKVSPASSSPRSISSLSVSHSGGRTDHTGSSTSNAIKQLESASSSSTVSSADDSSFREDSPLGSMPQARPIVSTNTEYDYDDFEDGSSGKKSGSSLPNSPVSLGLPLETSRPATTKPDVSALSLPRAAKTPDGDSSTIYDFDTDDIIISDNSTGASLETSQVLSARSLNLMGEEPDLPTV